MRKNLLFTGLWLLLVGCVWAQRPYDKGSKWYYHVENPLWYFDPPGNDINKAERKIGCAVYEVVEAKEIDGEMVSTVQRTEVNHLGEKVDSYPIVVYTQGKKVWMKQGDGARNLVHDPDLKEGEVRDLVMRFAEKEASRKLKARLSLEKVTQKEGYSCYSYKITVCDEQGIEGIVLHYDYIPEVGALDGTFCPTGVSLQGFGYTDVNWISTYENSLRAYVPLQGASYVAPWWKGEALSSKGNDAVYYRPLSTSLVDAAALYTYDPIAGRVVANPEVVLRIYGTDGLEQLNQRGFIDLCQLPRGEYLVVGVSAEGNDLLFSFKVKR